MSDNPILDEIHGIRAELSDQFGGDMRALGRFLREQQAASGVSTVTLPPKPVRVPVLNKKQSIVKRSRNNATATVPDVSAAQ